MRVKVLSDVTINGTPAVPGTVIDCDPRTAENLIRKGRLAPAGEAEAEPKAEPKTDSKKPTKKK